MKWKQRIAVALITAMMAGEASPPMAAMAAPNETNAVQSTSDSSEGIILADNETEKSGTGLSGRRNRGSQCDRTCSRRICQ